MMSRAQSAIEFLVIVGAVLSFLVFFIFFFYNSYADRLSADRNEALLEVALDVQNELALAADTGEGYMRTFSLPVSLYGRNYTLQLVDGTLYARTIDGKYALTVPVINATGTLGAGMNTIYTQGGYVYVNATL